MRGARVPPVRRRRTLDVRGPLAFAFAIAVVAFPAAARAQVGQLLSPGPLSRAHASLVGAE
jgi:hypothetical protein